MHYDLMVRFYKARNELHPLYICPMGSMWSDPSFFTSMGYSLKQDITYPDKVYRKEHVDLKTVLGMAGMEYHDEIKRILSGGRFGTFKNVVIIAHGYRPYKEDPCIPSHRILFQGNIVTFENSAPYSYVLFEKDVFPRSSPVNPKFKVQLSALEGLFGCDTMFEVRDVLDEMIQKNRPWEFDDLRAFFENECSGVVRIEG